ncbi:MAG: AsmA family protein [Ignavibacteria bacterium]|nr:AsmA family protein [Ignavibacteria bacterium]
MALGKTARTWLIILSIPVVLLIALVIAAKLYFTSDRLKALVIPRIEEATNRSVSVRDVSFSIFPPLAVSIDELKISNPAGRTFRSNEFLSLDNLKLNVSLFKLLQNKLEINYIILNHPKIVLEVTKDGTKNYSSGEAGAEGLGNAHVTMNKTSSLLLSNLEINDGEIELVDKKFDSHMVISGLHQTAKVRTRTGENTLEIEAVSAIGKFSYGTLASWYLSDQPLTASEKLTYNIGEDVLSFDNVSAKLRDLSLKIGGTISNFQQKTMIVNLNVSSPGAEMTQILSLIPPEMLKKTSGLSSSGDVKFSLLIKGASSETMNPATQALFTIENGKIKYALLPKSITNINLSGTFEKPEARIGAKEIGSFAINNFTATLGSNTIGGKLRMANFDDPTLTASFTGLVNLNEVRDYYPLEQGSEFSGTMKANVALDGKVKSPESMKANGNIEFKNVTMKMAGSPRPLRDLNGTIAFNNKIAESKQIVMNIGESDFNISFTLKNYLGMVMTDAAKATGTPSATMTLSSKQLRTADVISEKSNDAQDEEKSKGKVKKGSLLPGFNIDANVTIGRLVTEKFTFDNAHGTMNISNGIITLKNFSVNAFDGTIQSKGMLDVREMSKRPFNLDLDIKSVESHSLLPHFTSFGNYLFGKCSMTTKLQGDLNDTLGLNTQSLLGDGHVQVFDGKLLGMPLTNTLADFTNVTELREVNFKNWANAFSISNGRFNIKDLKVNAGATDFLLGGSQGLDGSLDYALTLKLPESMSGRLNLQGLAGELLQYFKDKDGRINLNLRVTGVAANPVLRLDTQAQQEMAKKAIEQKGNEAKQKLEDELKKKAEEGLKKLLKRP